ncbi:MAG: TOMM precursor leader peptide-binding protein, partial [Acidobacteria bacterium]|nr:TOMM precursor leader peptide-binding protein [Acidobacteriota bacterium]
KVFILSESGYFALTAQSCALVVQLIDGRRTTDEIADALKDQVSMNQAYYVLATLESKGFIEEATESEMNPSLAFWNQLKVESRAVKERLSATRLSLHSFGNVPTAEFRAQLESLGLQLTSPEESERYIALTDDYLQVGLAELNQRAIEEGKSWLLGKPNGMFVWAGPIFVPGETGCWECLSQRLRANRDIDTFVQDMTGRREPFVTHSALPSTIQLGLGWIATEAAKWVVLEEEGKLLEGKIISFNLAKPETQEHVLIKRPQCKVCGDPQIQAQLSYPIEIQSRPKLHVTDGGHRAVQPEETLRKFNHHVSPITGVVNRLVRITAEEDKLQHVYVSGANMAVRTYSFDILRSTLRSRTAGKGITDVQAKVSAIGEAIERYSGTYRGDEARVNGSFKSLGGQAINPETILLFSERQYREREKWLALNSPFMRVPLPFEEDAELEWAPVWSLTRKEIRYLPMELCYYSYPVRNEKHFCLPDSNGAAAGNTPEEAMLQGFMELVERDAVCLWWYNRVRRPAIDLESFDEPYIQNLKAFHKSANRDLWVLDLTTDLGIPAMVAISRRNDKPMEDIVFAPAAHFDPDIAVLRALTEMNQLVTAVMDVDKEGYTFDDEISVNWWKTATLKNQPHFVPLDSRQTRRQDFEANWSDDFQGDLLRCQSLVEKLGLEMLVHDQTRPDIGLPVLKIIVPGLRHFWARFAPGRLYDVPVKLGWLERPLTEDELNPIPVFI